MNLNELEQKYQELGAEIERLKSKPPMFELVDIPERSYKMGKTQVTQREWNEIMGNNPSYFKGDDLPVENISWDDAQEYIKKLNAKTGRKFRLPSEDEWEYCAKAGTELDYSGSNDPDEVAWHSGNSDGSTHPVGRKKPNAFGLYDMSGNVWEWTDSSWE